MKIAVFYYSQTGQAEAAARSICGPTDAACTVAYKGIVPLHRYPFPWSKDAFFDAFPESRLGLPPSGIEPLDFTDVADADLVVIVGQSWFLSPSLPLQSFFADEQVRQYLRGRQVVFVNACRNMWLMTARRVKQLLREADARLVGHIVLQDRAANLVSVVTIIRWLMYGRKEPTALLPAAGVADRDVREAARFAPLLRQAVSEGQVGQLQERLLAAGAIDYKPSVLMLEQVGHRMFGLWAKFVRRKGSFGHPARRFRLNLFYAYLLIVLFLISPFAQLFFYLTYPLHHVGRHRQEDCSIS